MKKALFVPVVIIVTVLVTSWIMVKFAEPETATKINWFGFTFIYK